MIGAVLRDLRRPLEAKWDRDPDEIPDAISPTEGLE